MNRRQRTRTAVFQYGTVPRTVGKRTEPLIANKHSNKGTLSNIKINLDFDKVSHLKDNRKRIINGNCSTNKSLKSNNLSKVDSK